MAMKLSTTLSHITTVPNSRNSKIISEFYHYLKGIGTSETIKIRTSRQSLFMQSFQVLKSPSNLSDTHRIEESDIHYNNRGDIAE